MVNVFNYLAACTGKLSESICEAVLSLGGLIEGSWALRMVEDYVNIW